MLLWAAARAERHRIGKQGGIVRMDGLLAAVAAWIVGVISALGYVGVAGLMAAESACTPLPSEIIMPFAGYLASTGRFSLVLVATAGALGCNLGSAVAYAVGAYGGRPAVLRWGRYLLVGPEEIAFADRFFQRFGGAAVFLARLLPLVRTFIALPAGVARMPVIRFHLYTFAGSWPWCFGLAYIGYVLGNKWNSSPALRIWMHRFDILVLGLVALSIGWFVWWRLRRRDSPQRG
jgi:membrane protein DedA with SNARE-associated domain